MSQRDDPELYLALPREAADDVVHNGLALNVHVRAAFNAPSAVDIEALLRLVGVTADLVSLVGAPVTIHGIVAAIRRWRRKNSNATTIRLPILLSPSSHPIWVEVPASLSDDQVVELLLKAIATNRRAEKEIT